MRIAELREDLVLGKKSVEEVVAAALARANGSVNRNTYIWPGSEAERSQNLERVGGEIARLPVAGEGQRLYGLPVSLKDCFDLAGAPTSCGTHFYAKKNGTAGVDSWVAARLRAEGAVVVGKTHMNALAYGITGENREYGDCVQPRNAAWLTGGSSSGAAASVQEGSAVAAIGTDTGGSIRVPAALCGLAGYRASIGYGERLGVWRGAMHLAKSFDTVGWLYGDLEDGPLLAGALLDVETPPRDGGRALRIARVGDEFLEDCDPAVRESERECAEELRRLSAEFAAVDVSYWSEAREIFTSIQAHEAAQLHAGYFAEFQAELRERLEWGASIGDRELGVLHERHASFRDRMDRLLAEYDFLLLPAAPVAQLAVGGDHSQTRMRLLRYTAPVSLAGMPAVTIPVAAGGMQLVTCRDGDGRLLALTAQLGKERSRLSSTGVTSR